MIFDKLTHYERGILHGVLRAVEDDYAKGSNTWNTIQKAISALDLRGDPTTSEPSAPGSESASMESAGSSEPVEATLSALLLKLEKHFDSSSLSLKKGSAQWNFSHEAKPPTAATDSARSQANEE